MEAADLDPELGAVDLGAYEHGQHQQDDAYGAQDVLVPFDDLKVLDHGERAHHEAHSHKEEDELAHGGVGFEAGDECDADAGKGENDGQQRRVGARGEDPNADVRRGEGSEQAERHRERLEREDRAGVDHVKRVEQVHGERRGYEQEQFCGAATHCAAPPSVSSVGAAEVV